jgi:anaerobic magnesium-protoporphyrin IX monomethyl ester cyclase
LDLSLELATLGWNGYSAMPLPGSKLYKDALLAGHELPNEYTEYSFHSYDTKPVPNENLSSEEILRFRDEAYTKYHTSEKFLNKVRNKYGQSAVDNILENTKIKLKRKCLGD